MTGRNESPATESVTRLKTQYHTLTVIIQVRVDICFQELEINGRSLDVKGHFLSRISER